MGRPPSNGGPAFRFTPSEVAELEACLKGSNNQLPSREAIASLAENFSASLERAGKIAVQPKQVWNWFQNRRYSQRARVVKPPAKLPVSSAPREDSISHGDGSDSVSVTQGKKTLDGSQLEFEAKSSRDAAWYDVAAFLSHRNFETGDPEVRIRFAGFGVEEDEWVNVRRCVRQRSLPCEPAECSVVLPGDLILCFQEGNEQALYFDARVLDAQRRRHDVRGCRCRFLVRYDHDQSEEIVPLKKICRRPETEYRMHLLHGSKLQTSRVNVPVTNDYSQIGKSKDSSLTVHTAKKESKAADVKMDAVVLPAQQNEPERLEVPPTEGNTSSIHVPAGGTT